MSGSAQIWGGVSAKLRFTSIFLIFFTFSSVKSKLSLRFAQKIFSGRIWVSGTELELFELEIRSKTGRDIHQNGSKMVKIGDFHIKQPRKRLNRVLNTCAHLIPANINTPTYVEVLLNNKNVTFQVGGHLSFRIQSIFCVKICDFHVKQPQKR